MAIFAALTSHPSLLACQLKRLEGQVRLQDGQPVNIVGLGSYAQEDVLLQRQPAQDVPANLSALLPPDHSEALLYSAQIASPSQSLESAQPFRFLRWLFTYEGTLPGFDQFRHELLDELPPYLQRQIGAETEGEAAFAVFLKYLRDTGRTDDRRLEARVAAELMGRTARELLQRSAKTGAVHTGSVNMVATNAQLLVAARASNRALYFKLLEGSDRCDMCGLPPGKSEVEPLVRSHLRSRAIALATDLGPSARWLELAAATALGVGQDFQIHQVKF